MRIPSLIGLLAVLTLGAPAVAQDAENQPPTASFTVSDESPRQDQKLTFMADASDPDGSVDQIHWTFGQGTSKTGQEVSHTYLAAGTYQVVLTVTDDAGANTTASKTLEVAPRPLDPRDFGRETIRPLMEEFQTTMDNIDQRLSTMITVTENHPTELENQLGQIQTTLQSQTEALNRMADAVESQANAMNNLATAIQESAPIGDQPIPVRIENDSQDPAVIWMRYWGVAPPSQPGQ